MERETAIDFKKLTINSTDSRVHQDSTNWRLSSWQ